MGWDCLNKKLQSRKQICPSHLCYRERHAASIGHKQMASGATIALTPHSKHYPRFHKAKLQNPCSKMQLPPAEGRLGYEHAREQRQTNVQPNEIVKGPLGNKPL